MSEKYLIVIGGRVAERFETKSQRPLGAQMVASQVLVKKGYSVGTEFTLALVVNTGRVIDIHSAEKSEPKKSVKREK